MGRTRAELRRGPAERLDAWLVTGPAGHFWSAAVDLALILARLGWARARGRDPYGLRGGGEP
ncbi:MAG: hypothetical protein ACM3UV_01830 [Nocardioidaceae bacterium]